MPSDLTPTRLRALIAAATPGPWCRHGSHFYAESDRQLLGTIEGPLLVENADLFLDLFNNASALAEALEAKELLEWAMKEGWASFVAEDRCGEWSTTRVRSIDALRAAKEAADGELRKEDQ